METMEEATPGQAATQRAGIRAKRRQQPSAYPLFFLGTTLLALLAPPLWVGSYLGHLGLPSPPDPATHAHEMLFGYATGIMAGFLITRAHRLKIWLAFAGWMLARLGASGVFPGAEPMAAVGSLVFVAVLFVLAGLPFIRAARVGHNLLFAPILAVLVAGDATYQVGLLAHLPDLRQRAVLVSMDAVAAMVFVMGGRIIAGLTAGILRRLGISVDHRAQLPFEYLGCIALGGAAVADALGSGSIATAASAMAGLAALGRLLRWHSWRLWNAGDAGRLTFGYAWLAFGLILPASGLLPRTEAVHAFTIGALGLLGHTMMIRTVQMRRRLSQVFPPLAWAGLAAVLLAALFRLSRPMLGATALIWAAAWWSLAFLILLGVLLRLLRQPPTRALTGDDEPN